MQENKNESIVQKIDRFKEEGKKYRKQIEDTINECERFYEGQHWRQRDPSKRAKNYVFQTVEAMVPLLIDPMPATNVIVKDDAFKEQAEILEAAKAHVYREQEILLKDVQSVRDLLVIGQGWQYVGFDADGENGEGSVTIKNLSWDQVIVDPAASSVDQARYSIISIPISNEELKRLYPKTAQQALTQPLKDAFKFTNSKYYDENQNTGSYGSNYDTSRYESKDMTHIEECYLRDYSMEAIPDDETQIQITEETAQLQEGVNPDVSKWEDHEAHYTAHEEQKYFIASEMLKIPVEQVTPDDIKALKENDQQAALLFTIIEDHQSMHKMYAENMDEDEIGKRPKYPNHLRLVVKTGQVVHYDGAPDVQDGLVPLVAFYNYKGTRIYADGDVKNIIPLQKTINELDEKELKGLKLNANPGWIKDEQSGVDEDTLTDEDGLVVTKQAGTEVSRLSPGQVSPQLQNRSQVEIASMKIISGMTEAALGESPKQQMAGIAMRRMQMQALGRVRLKSKMIEVAVFRRDKLILSRIIKFWSQERKLRAEDGNGKYSYVSFSPNAIRDLDYDVVIAPGTMAGMDNETIYEAYKELLLAGAIDLKTFLEVTSLPKKQVILDKLAEQDQTQAQTQQLLAQLIQLKTQFAPETITDEELAMAQQLGIQ